MTQLDVQNPYNLEVIGSITLSNESDLEKALSRAEQLHRNRHDWLQPHQRVEILQRVHSLLSPRREELARKAAEEGGKPLADSLVEVDRGLLGIQLAANSVEKLHGTEVPMGLSASSTGRFAVTRREPGGVAVAISAFNHPFNLIVHQVIPAVASGCPVIVKPATTTPFSCETIVAALQEAGLPEGWCQCLHLKNELAQKLVGDPRVSFLTFIGSARVGWSLRSQLSPGAHCALEHGGVAPLIVDESANIEAAVKAITKGGYYHAGQVCVSVQRIFAHNKIQGRLLEQLSQSVKSLHTGDPLREDTEVGPLIRPSEVDRVSQWVEEARESGGDVLVGGKPMSKTCYEPTLVLNPAPTATLSTAEVFGPVCCVYSYSELDEAVQRANSLPFAFQSAIFTEDLSRAFYATERLEARTVLVNDHTAFRVDWMPFGGYKQSGLGVGGIFQTMLEMTREKMTVFNTPLASPRHVP